LCCILPYDQSHKNSPESASRKEVETGLPINLYLEQHLQSARNDTVCEAVSGICFSNDMRNTVVSRGEEDENKHELLELFRLRPNGKS
jgi:hypothetical protein